MKRPLSKKRLKPLLLSNATTKISIISWNPFQCKCLRKKKEPKQKFHPSFVHESQLKISSWHGRPNQSWIESKLIFVTSGPQECYSSIRTTVYKRHLPELADVVSMQSATETYSQNWEGLQEVKEANLKGSVKRDELW